MTTNHGRLPPALVETIAGLSAGTISALAVHPLDVIKTRLQIQANQGQTPGSAFSIFRSLIKNDHPIQSLYRGLTPNLLGNASSWALFFYFKSLVETKLSYIHKRQVHPAPENNPRTHPTDVDLSPADYFISSGIAGVLVLASTNPIWVLKTRMLSSDKGSAGAYDSTWHGARHLFRTEGVRGFYRGAGISLVGNLHGAVQFSVYDPLKKVWRRYMRQEENGTGEKLGNTATLVISGAAKVVAGTVTYPYQVLRSRLQTYDAEERFGKGIRGVAAKLWREEGWKGFYKGLGTNIVRVLPATWVTFLVYENARFYLSR